MSMLLMVKAMQCKVGNPTRKLVLLKLADNANDEGICFRLTKTLRISVKLPVAVRSRILRH
ncbi:Uncharacterised protein [Avibacterium paragallinarum]|uniref:Uncharacterized protein n=1 Tax=Avibacterium paragallinarum TaxID=728 RepID=A0A380X631_AVIPA|nr:Uncharacterised protein [Avibacterium paragallinarum]